MLVLTRKRYEMIRIGDSIAVTVLDILGNSVRLGIEAPAALSVHREEVYRAIQREQGPDVAGPGTKDA